ncbi:MAG: heavy metal-responsive transcriptional regulator [Cyanobacteria bacterium P01_A01_bin.135]
MRSDSPSDRSTPSNRLKIGQVAKVSGLPIKTIRYYEDIGLLSPTVARSPAGYRLFAPAVLNRLSFIKRAQNLGLSLDEVRQVLGVHDQGQLPCRDVKDYLVEKLAAVQDQINELTLLQGELQDILSRWQEEPPLERQDRTICPNIQR